MQRADQGDWEVKHEKAFGWHPKWGSPSHHLEPQQRQTLGPGSESVSVEGSRLLNPTLKGTPFC